MKKGFICKLLSGLMIVVLLMSFSGCGKKTVTSSESEGLLLDFEDEHNTISDTSKEEGTNKEGTGGSDGGAPTIKNPVKMGGSDPYANIPERLKGTTVKFAHWGDDGAAEYEKVLKAFTKKTGIKYQLVTYSEKDYINSISKQIAAKSGPDVIISVNTFPSALEIAQPIQNIIDLNDDFWDDNTTKLSTVNGNTYFVNSLKSCWYPCQMVYYNKKIFADSAITSPKDYYDSGKWTYETFHTCLQQVKQAGFVGGSADPMIMSTQMGAPMVSYDIASGKFKNNVSNMAPAYEFVANCFKEGLWPDGNWYGTFTTGRVGMVVQSLYGAKYNGFFKDVDDSVLAAVPLPTSYKGQTLKQVGQPRMYGIARGSKNPEGAAYLIRYFLDYSNYAAAGANVFKNKSLEKVYFDEVIPSIKKQGLVFDVSTSALILIGENQNLLTNEVRTCEAAQVKGKLQELSNVVDNAVKKSADKLAAIK